MSLKDTQVFTPTWVTDEMLDLLDQSIFSSDEAFFFEPSCGDGAILVPMLERIYSSLLKSMDHERALAETLHKFFAVELDEEMVKRCRVNVWKFIESKTFSTTDYRKLSEYLIANQIKNSIEHNDFFKVMDESNSGAIGPKNKRQSLQKLRRNETEK